MRFETPGKILQYLKIYNENDLDISNDKLSCIFNLVDKYKKKKDAQLLNFIYLLVEFFYNDLIYDKNKNTDLLYFNRSKILKEINNVKKFNLDKNNLFITIQGILKNEQ